jgi:uncharacterized membrane protein YraQ (UPF0718 family)
MCDICKTAKRLPSTREALHYLAGTMLAHSTPVCVDTLIGELAGVPAPKVDRKAEADWERANHDTT